MSLRHGPSILMIILHLQTFLHGILDAHFALSPMAPRSRYISPAVWNCRQRCQQLKKRTRCFRETFVRDVQELAFHSWRLNDLAGLHRACTCFLLKEVFGAAIGYATKWAKEKIKRDRTEALHEWLATLRHLPGHKILQALKRFGLGSRRKAVAKAPPPGVRLGDGSWALGRAQLNDAWLRFFGDMEAGVVKSTSSFIQEANARADSCEDGILFRLQTLPTICEIEQAFRTMTPGKSCGLDLLPPEIFKSCPQQLAQAYLPLMMKSCLRLVQPLAWTGGVLFELYKGAGAHQLMENHRSIFLASCAGKSLHKILRAKVTATIGAQLDGLHCGSRKEAPVTLPALAVQLLCRMHKRLNRSFGVFLLDVKCAFYSVIREVAIGGVEADSQVERLFCRFGLNGEDIALLRDIIRQGGTMTASGLDDHLAAVVRSTYAYTWFVTRHGSQDKLCHTVAGSRPGANFADLVFAFIYGRVLERLRGVVADKDAALQVPFSGVKTPWPSLDGSLAGHVACIDASWADDTAAVSGHSDPRQMMTKLLVIASTLMDQCQSFGLRPNLKRGKCAFLVAIRGRHSKACRVAYFSGGRNQLCWTGTVGWTLRPVGVSAVQQQPLNPPASCFYKAGLSDLLTGSPCFSPWCPLRFSTWSCGAVMDMPGSLSVVATWPLQDDSWLGLVRRSTTCGWTPARSVFVRGFCH